MKNEISPEKITLENWRKISVLKGKIASEEDFKSGIAVFYLNNCSSKPEPADIKLPALANFFDESDNTKKIVVVVQAEKCNDDTVVGIRFMDGSDGICDLKELEFIESN